MTRECKHCGTPIHDSEPKKKIYCNATCKTEFSKADQRRKFRESVKTCVSCSKEFTPTKGRQKTCSEECKVAHEARLYKEMLKRDQAKNLEKSLVKYKDAHPDEYVACAICGLRAPNLSSHPRVHDMTNDEYMKQHGSLVSVNTANSVKGENNPAYQHGGKYSPFSKKFVKYVDLSENEIQNRIEGVVDTSMTTRSDNGNDNTTLEYYIQQGMTETEAKNALRERQRTFTLDKCIEKYGEFEGRIRWQERQDKWMETLDSKSPEEIIEINKKKSTKFNFSALWNHKLTDRGWFYILKYSDTTYKIGITTKDDIYGRYSQSELKGIEVVLFEEQEDIHHAFMIEQVMKRNHVDNIGGSNVGMAGWTEMINDVSLAAILEEMSYLRDNEDELIQKFNSIERKSTNANL